MKTLLALSVLAATISAAAPALAHDCGCKVRHAKAHHTVRHATRAAVRRVVVIREPVIIRERVVVREPVYVRERPVIVHERVWRPAPYPARVWGERFYGRGHQAVRFDQPYHGWRDRGEGRRPEWRGRGEGRDYERGAERGWGGRDGHGEGRGWR